MKLHRFTSRGLFIAALALWALEGAALAQLPKSTKNADLTQEIDIFGSVIKDTLTDKGVVKGVASGGGGGAYAMPGGPAPMGPGFIGVSPFDWRIHSQYVPTVGVIYMIPVSFPLVNPEEKAEKPETTGTPEQPQDLWEKHEKEAEEPPKPGGMPHAISSGEMGLSGPEVAALDEELAQLNMYGAQAALPAGPAGPAYDPEKVKSLRSALLDVLAQYGYRLKDLPEDEQILFVVTSSGSSFGGGPKSVFVRSDKAGKKRVSIVSSSGAQGGSGDQYLLAVKKKDLAAKLTPDQLEGKLTERVF